MNKPSNVPRKGQQGFQKGKRKPSRAPSPGYTSLDFAKSRSRRDDAPNFGFLHRAMLKKAAEAKEAEELAALHPPAKEERAPGERIREGLDDGQIPMWMTPREITAQFAPLENDRLYWYEDGRGSPDHDETDDEFWDRKLKESKGAERRLKFPPLSPDGSIPPAPSRSAPGFVHPDYEPYRSESNDSLYDELVEDGVKNPVSLQLPSAAEDGKPQVLGGHHRIAAMKDIAPDSLMPVEFHESMKQAKDSLGEAY